MKFRNGAVFSWFDLQACLVLISLSVCSCACLRSFRPTALKLTAGSKGKRLPLRMNSRLNAAFTWVEALVAIAVLSVLVILALPSSLFSGGCMVSGQKTQTLSNMRQLHLATQSMALDGVTDRNTNLAWPGDTGGSFSNWTRQIVPAYLGTNDFFKLMSAPGVAVRSGKLPTRMTDCALRVYAVTGEASGSFVFLTTANFTNTPHAGPPLQKDAKPYGDTGFVVFRKGGDGAILLKNQAAQTNLIGEYAPLLK